MAKETMGGRNLTDLFRLKLNEAGDAWEVLDKLTDVAAATPTREHAALSLTLIGSSKPAFQADGTVKLTFDHYDSGADLYAFLDKTAVVTTTSTRPETKLEDGTTIGGTQASDELILAISYLQYDNDDTPTKVFTIEAVGSISAESGSFETSSDGFNKPTFEFIGKKVSTVSLPIPAALYETTTRLATVSSPPTIAIGKGYHRGYQTKHA